MTISEINPIYNSLYSYGTDVPDWTHLRNFTEENIFAMPDKPDFVLTSKPPPWYQTVLKILVILLKIMILPWGIYEAVKLIAREIGMDAVYPAHTFSKDHVKIQRLLIADKLKREPDLLVRDLNLKKDGVSYSGMMIGRADTIANKKWILFAAGNTACVEDAVLIDIYKPCFDAGYNLLLVNGPSVGFSEGIVDHEKIGDPQELGIQFLEKVIHAENIGIIGHSLGGAAIGDAVMKHKFDTDKINYFVMRLMTFDKLSNIIRKVGGVGADWVRWWLDCEIDSVAASKKLEALGIYEVLMKGQLDEYMKGVDLMDAVERIGGFTHKKFISIPNAGHLDIPRDLITKEIQVWDEAHPIANTQEVLEQEIMSG